MDPESDYFTPELPIQSGPTGVITARGNTIRFGDGYEALYTDGFHEVVQSWPITFHGTYSEIEPIKQFLDFHMNKSFYWTPPLGEEGRYTARSYSLTPEAPENFRLSVTLDQVFRP